MTSSDVVVLPAMSLSGESHAMTAFVSRATPLVSHQKEDVQALDFWSEEENQSFAEALKWLNALNHESLSSDFETIAARVGSKSLEQCKEYAKLYLKALQAKKRTFPDSSMASLGSLTASEVYTCQGLGDFYSEYQQQQAAAHGSMTSRNEMPGDAAEGGSKSSITFLCKTEAPISPESQEVNIDSSAPREQDAPSREPEAPKEDGDAKSPTKEVGTWGGKRKRQETTTETLEGQIESVPHDTMWEYSAMEESTLDPARNRGKNPWDWVRKVINKSNGYAQWWPFFNEHVILTKREACDDLKCIRAKAPPPPVDMNPYSRKFSVEKVGAPQTASISAAPKVQKPNNKSARVSPEAEPQPAAKKGKTSKTPDGRLVLQPGDFIEVKWGNEWWHAQVVKVGRTSRTGYVWVSYVGGTEEEEEWIAFENIRMPKEDVSQVIKGKKGEAKTVKKKSNAFS